MVGHLHPGPGPSTDGRQAPPVRDRVLHRRHRRGADRASGHADLEAADTIDPADQQVALLDRRHAFGRAGVDQVAGLAAQNSVDRCSMVSARFQISSDVALLARGAVDVQRDRALGDSGRMALAGWIGPIGPECVEGLADLPTAGPASWLRPAGRAGSCPGRWRSRNMRVAHRIRGLDVAAALADGGDQFDLVVQVAGARRVGQLAGGAFGARPPSRRPAS
jgi:hypothetical protein